MKKAKQLPAQTPSDTHSATRLEEEVLQVDLLRSVALRNGDVATLVKLYSDDFIMITSTGEIRTKQDQLEDIASGRFQHPRPQAKILRLRVYGEVAIVHSEGQGEVVVNGQPDDVFRRYTRIYVKNAGHWQLTATHVSRVSAP
jgi:ketosteroid isomerase-like protein